MVVDPIAISIGPLDIRWYGLVYVLGFLFAYWFVTHYARFFSLPKEKVEDIFFWVMVGSVLGGRLF
jgi:phosphatidylglycerol:prolipoprotein diacylglycerol transferase